MNEWTNLSVWAGLLFPMKTQIVNSHTKVAEKSLSGNLKSVVKFISSKNLTGRVNQREAWRVPVLKKKIFRYPQIIPTILQVLHSESLLELIPTQEELSRNTDTQFFFLPF